MLLLLLLLRIPFDNLVSPYKALLGSVSVAVAVAVAYEVTLFLQPMQIQALAGLS